MDIWQKMYEKAQALYQPQEVSDFVYARHVVAAVEAEDGQIFTGFCMEGLRYAPKMRNQAENYFLYQCQSCGHTYRRKRRVNTQKFGCGLCQGKLIFLNQS